MSEIVETRLLPSCLLVDVLCMVQGDADLCMDMCRVDKLSGEATCGTLVKTQHCSFSGRPGYCYLALHAPLKTYPVQAKSLVICPTPANSAVPCPVWGPFNRQWSWEPGNMMQMVTYYRGQCLSLLPAWEVSLKACKLIYLTQSLWPD